MAKTRNRRDPNSGEAEEMLMRANEHLSTREYHKALELYTKVIYDVSPGHICALLNRSLAYLALGYPELAAVDAYRAVLAANDTRKITSKSANRRFLTIEKYVKVELEHSTRKALWTVSPNSSISRLPGMWLGCIFIGGNNRDSGLSICAGFELRAMFRLCAALKFCSGGALIDVFGLIDDVIAYYKPELDERRQFRALADEAMNEVETIREQERKMMGRFAGSEEEYEATGDMGFETMAKTKMTFIQRASYPWSYPNQPSSPGDTGHSYTDVEGRCILHDSSGNVELPAKWDVRAAKDFYPNEAVFSEKSHLQVTTSSQGQNVDRTDKPPTFYCDSCSALLILPAAFRDKIVIEQDSDSKFPDICFSPCSGSTDDIWAGNRDIYIDQLGSPDSYLPPEFFSQGSGQHQPSAPIPPPPPPPPPIIKPDFVICTTCNEVPYCSAKCQNEAKAYHNHVCAANIESPLHDAIPREDRIPSSSLPPSASTSIYTHPKAQYLYDIILLRIFAQSLKANKHPLDNPTIRLLPSGSHAPRPSFNPNHPLATVSQGSNASALSKEPRHTLPWSFMTHVARPIRYLHEYYEGQAIDPFTRIHECDGWMINELMWKIKRATRVTKGPRWAKIYNDDGSIVREVRGVDMAQEIRGEVGDEEVWVGTMHPVFSLVKVADEEKGEKANVVVEEGNVLRCVAAGREIVGDEDVVMEGGEPCIKDWDPIVRAADAVIW